MSHSVKNQNQANNSILALGATAPNAASFFQFLEQTHCKWARVSYSRGSYHLQLKINNQQYISASGASLSDIWQKLQQRSEYFANAV